MKAIGIIPSRWGSTRFPGKSLCPLLGRPLVAWVVDAVKKAKSLDEVLVATDDERIAAIFHDLVLISFTEIRQKVIRKYFL